MATTSIWSVKGWLGKVVIYVENPEKTTAPEIAKFPRYENEGAVQREEKMQSLSDVIAYAVNAEKTRRKGKKGEEGIVSETEQIMQQYVSGINCTPATARNEMIAVKKRYGKDEGIVAFHGYQSFAWRSKNGMERMRGSWHFTGISPLHRESVPRHWPMRSASVWRRSCGESVFRCWLPPIWIRPIIFITISWSILFPILTGNGITEQIRIIGICERSLTGSAGSTVCP